MKDKYSPIWEKAIETTSPTPSGTVNGLIEGNEYQFRVVAVNKAGQSIPSEPGKTFIAKPRFCKNNKYFFLCFILTNSNYSGTSY